MRVRKRRPQQDIMQAYDKGAGRRAMEAVLFGALGAGVLLYLVRDMAMPHAAVFAAAACAAGIYVGLVTFFRAGPRLGVWAPLGLVIPALLAVYLFLAAWTAAGG